MGIERSRYILGCCLAQLQGPIENILKKAQSKLAGVMKWLAEEDEKDKIIILFLEGRKDEIM